MRIRSTMGLMIGGASLALSLLLCQPARADGIKDNLPDQVRPIPAIGVELSAADRGAIEQGLRELNQEIVKLRELAKKDAKVAELLPDVEIFDRAVRQALDYREFFEQTDVGKGQNLLKQGLQRAKKLLAGEAPWTRQTGLVARGFTSKLDGTVQPYVLVIPSGYQFDDSPRHRLDVWLHGRNEPVCELNFLDMRQKQVGNIQPADTIVLHPFGRYCNAFKMAGEVDVLEALESVQSRYRVDEDRVVIRGFSMGGAGTWHLTVHYPGLWAASNPGAGFSETPQFLDSFQSEKLTPTAFEKTLWHWYNCDDWCGNLLNCPTIAYSGELDIQKQAADVMAAALAKQGVKLTHIIGPGTKHEIHPASLIDIERRLAGIVKLGRERAPQDLEFTTYTLRYNRMAWVELEALEEHWQVARVHATMANESTVEIATENVMALKLAVPSGYCALAIGGDVDLLIDDQTLEVAGPETDRSWTVRLVKTDDTWRVSDAPLAGRKRPGQQGPIDDALLDAFVFVRPTGKPRNEAVDRWAKTEMDHAAREWRRQFRGVANMIDDTKLDDATIASKNLVLWGDPGSNAVLGKIADKLPIRWTEKSVIVGDREFDAAHHAVALVFPNPLNPERYVVLNSGATYREYEYLNNARQVAKLPDWAVIDIRTPPDTRWPGNVVAADFFDEFWKVKTGKTLSSK